MAIASGAYKKALEGNQQPKEVLVKIDRVTKQFDETLAVDTVSLTINKGEIFALLGGSGSGKSTLLRMLAGFERPTEGRIFLDGQDITDLPPYERPINMMFQSYALFPHMSVAQNIAFGLKQDGLPKAEIDERVAEMLKLVHMTQYAKRKPHQLSGGQRQRVALARSLAKRPKLLLLDEPMGALDKKLRSQMQLELVEIIERVGVTCVMVTHDQEEAMTMAQRIAIMHLGCIEQIGSPMDIYGDPGESPGLRVHRQRQPVRRRAGGGRAGPCGDRLPAAGEPDLHRPRHQHPRRGQAHHLRAAAGEGDDQRAEAGQPGTRRAQLGPGHRLRHRLPWRPLGVLHQAGLRDDRPGFHGQRRAPRRPADLGPVGVHQLVRRQRRGTAVMKFANSLKKRMPTGRHAVIGVPFLWLFLFFLLPFAIVLKISLAEADVAIPPYTEIFAYADQQLQVLLNLGNYLMLTDDPLYIDAYLGSLKMAFISTLICLLVGYPMAYAIARSSQSSQTVLLLLIMMPTWTAILIRVYAWMGILSNNGLLNSVLMGLGLISEPLTILNTNIAVYIGIVYSYLPFMILPLYANLVKHDPSLLEAASDLGARNFTSFWKITVPLSKNGIIAGCMLVFIPAVGEFVIPELLGGPETLMIGKVLWQEFFNNRDWPVASALAVVMLAILIIPIILFNKNQAKELEGKV